MADHCFEALTNKEQWESFAAENKTIADKIKDFIKEFVAMINRAFDKYFVHDNAEIRNEVLGEVDYMNEIARRLSEGVDEAVENYRFGAGTEGETKYQLVGETSDGIEVYETSDKTKALTEKERKKQYLSLMRNKYAGRTARFVRNGHTYYAEFDRSNYNKPIYGEFHNSAQGKKALIRLGADGDVFELVENAEYSASRADSKNHKVKDGFTDYFDYFVKTVQIDGRFYDLTATVKKKYGEKHGYTYSLFLRNNKTRTAPTMEQQNVSFKVSAQPLSDTTVTQGNGNVNTHSMQKSKNNSSFSISDSNGNQLSENQQKYFADSKVRDEKGNLKVMYRGGNNTDTVFRRENTHGLNLYGRGFYFTDSESHAKQYGTATEYYLKIDNPLSTEDHKITKAQLRNFIDTVANDEEYGIDNYGQGATVDSVFNSVWGKDDFSMIQDINATAIGDMVEATKIFNAVNRTNYDGFILGTETVIFNSEQAKLTDNQNPTDNPDVRYSVSDIDNYTEEMYDNFGWVKVNDVLSSQALSRMYSQFASINTGVYFDKTPEGYYIIPTGDYNKASNYLVYISGTMEMPVIQKIIKLNLDNETNIYIARMVLDGFERNRPEQSDRARKTCGDLFSDKEIITEYNRKDFASYQEIKARTRQSMHASQRNNRAVRDGGRNTSEDSSGSEVTLSDDQRASISDAGMRLTDDTELSSLMRENADYKAEIERLKGELVKSKRMGGKGKNRLMQADINRIAREIISDYSSEISFYDLKYELTGFYEFLANADVESSGDYAFIVKTANDIAKSVIAQSFTDITPEEFADYKKALRGYRLIPNLEDVAELEQMFGTFGAAYRQYGKKLNMRAQGTPGALHIDEVWEELCEAVPLLDRNADSTQEMWRNLIEVRDSLDENTGFNPYLDGGEFSAGQTAAVLGADILERFNEISPDTTFADRAQQRVDLREQKISELKAEKQEALSKLRNQRDARISELKESFREQNAKKERRKKAAVLAAFLNAKEQYNGAK